MGALSYCNWSISRSRTCSISVGLKGAILASLLGVSGCGSLEANVAAGIVGATLYGGQSPTHEIEQIYYLGTFDPREQLPPTIYRIRVHGQASAISGTKFASGWVPASVIDSLNTHVGFDVNDPSNKAPIITEGEARLQSKIKTGRRLIQFGPEGFREAPANHRLVIVMGASPQAFFQAIDTSLGQLGQFRAQKADESLKSDVLEALLALNGHQRRLDDLGDDVEVFLLQSAITGGVGQTTGGTADGSSTGESETAGAQPPDVTVNQPKGDVFVNSESESGAVETKPATPEKPKDSS